MENKYYRQFINSKNIFVVLLVFYIAVYILFELNLNDFKLNMLRIIKVLIIILIFIGLYIGYNGLILKNKKRDYLLGAIYVILAIGILLRLLRVYNFSWDTYQHDVVGNGGHMDYIKFLVYNNMLPDRNSSQFYHPPLHHFISALWIKINLFFNVSELKAIEGIQYLTAFYSSAAMIIGYKIFKVIGFKDKILLLSTSLIATAPTFIILASSLNNDMLMILFIFIVILYSIKWYEEPTFKNIIILAIALGLGMMTKVTAVLCAATIGGLFLIKLHKGKKLFSSKLWKQYFLFATVSIPLGIWYQIRNLIKFGQPFGYVLPISKNHDLYVGNYGFIERFLEFDFIKNIINNPKCMPYDEYNLPTYLIKSSMLNEYLPNYQGKLIVLLLILNTIMIFFSLIAMVYVIKVSKEKRIITFIMGSIWLVQMVSFIYFNIRYPFGCTMDYRYIVPTLLTGIVFLGLALQDVVNTRRKNCGRVNFIFSLISISFILSSIVVYTL